MHDQELHLDWQPSTDVFVVNIVETEFWDSQQVTKTSVVSNKDKILLILGEHFAIFLLVRAEGSKKGIPNRHEQTVVGIEVCVMSQMVLGCVEKIGQGGKGAGEEPVSNPNVGVTKRVGNVKEQQVSSNHRPVHAPGDQERDQKGWSKRGNVQKVLVKVLDKRGGRKCVDGKMMKAMHGLHLCRTVQPSMGKVIERFDDKNVGHEHFKGTVGNLRRRRKEHGRENELQGDLDVHVQEISGEVVVFFSFELLLSEFVEIVVLVDKHVVQGQEKMCRHHSHNGGNVQWNNGGDWTKQEWPEKEEPIIPSVSFLCRVGRNISNLIDSLLLDGLLFHDDQLGRGRLSFYLGHVHHGLSLSNQTIPLHEVHVNTRERAAEISAKKVAGDVCVRLRALVGSLQRALLLCETLTVRKNDHPPASVCIIRSC